jgi:lysophospholipase L1-like esterase
MVWGASRWMKLAVVLAQVVALTVMTATVVGVTASSAALKKGATIYYLDVGASVSVGVQPTPQAPKGQPTNEGYGNKLVTLEVAKGVSIHLTKIGCPGESTFTLISGNNPCYRSVDNQLSDAEAYLRVHHLRDVLVTIDLGFNNVVQCMRFSTIDQTCVNHRFTQLQRQLPMILKSLTQAAGPNVTLIGVGHYDPFLACAIHSAKYARFAQASAVVIARLNTVIQKDYRSFAIPMADVAGAFKTNNTSLVNYSKLGAIATNVAQICSWTWMCAPSPYGPNLHPNDRGYMAIARAILAVMPAKI